MDTTQEGGGVFCFPQVDACKSDEEVANFQQVQDNPTIALNEVGELPVREAAKVAIGMGGVQSEQCRANSGDISLNPRETRSDARHTRTTAARTQTIQVS